MLYCVVGGSRSLMSPAVTQAGCPAQAMATCSAACRSQTGSGALHRSTACHLHTAALQPSAPAQESSFFRAELPSFLESRLLRAIGEG